MTRTKNDIKERISKIEDLKFYLNMKDHWSFDDYRTMDRYRAELKALKKEMEAM